MRQPGAGATAAADQYEWRRRSELNVLAWPAFDHYEIDAFVTTRGGGTSLGSYSSLNLGLHVGDDDAHVMRNRTRVADTLSVSLDDFVFCDQAHRSNVSIVTDEHRGRGAHACADAIPDTDALVTVVPGIVLMVMVADCVPLVLYDPVAGILSCVHAGWRGTVRGVTPAAVRTMCQLGSDPRNIIAGLGPAITPERNQVGQDVVDAATAAFGDRVEEVIRPDGTGKWTFDLWRANALQLSAAGVPWEKAHLAAIGTGPGTPFFSHRAESPCGRIALAARIREQGSL
ncbi:MAG: polyphenol oxidase family protein [Pseudonocardiaceae bacterium]